MSSFLVFKRVCRLEILQVVLVLVDPSCEQAPLQLHSHPNIYILGCLSLSSIDLALLFLCKILYTSRPRIKRKIIITTLLIKSVLWIRIRLDRRHFAGSGSVFTSIKREDKVYFFFQKIEYAVKNTKNYGTYDTKEKDELASL
jgi:hypothetical protein